jgi:hypothetical protein
MIAQMMQTDFLSYRLPNEIFTVTFKSEIPSFEGMDFNLSELKDVKNIMRSWYKRWLYARVFVLRISPLN